MADDSFTPGPWKESAYDGGWDCVRDSQDQIIAKLGLNNPANARLIASAPDLLEALQECAAPHRLGDAKTGIEWEALAREFSRRQGIAVAAIAKATGKPE